MLAHWESIKERLETILEPGPFLIWIKPLEASVTDETLTILAPNGFVAKNVREKLKEEIFNAATQTLGKKMNVVVRVAEKKNLTKNKSLEQAVAGAEIVSPLLSPVPQSEPKEENKLSSGGLSRFRFKFEDFVVGPSNELAHAAARSLCGRTLPTDQLVLCSGPGLGKTHLAHSIGWDLHQRFKQKNFKIRYLTAEEFASRFILAIRTRDMENFREAFRQKVDILLLEDVHFLQGKLKVQDELLSTLKALRENNSNVVLTSSFLPKDLLEIDSQLVSRLSSGCLAPIASPDLQTRKNILKIKAAKHNTTLPDEVRDLIAECIKSDVRQLESCLQSLIIKASIADQTLNLDMAKEILEHYMTDLPNTKSFNGIVDFICSSFELTLEDLRSKSRRKDLVTARNVIFYLSRKYTELTLEDMGQRLGRKHSTVLKGITSIERQLSLQTPSGHQLQDLLKRGGY